jgi:hypothetical protein
MKTYHEVTDEIKPFYNDPDASCSSAIVEAGIEKKNGAYG